MQENETILDNIGPYLLFGIVLIAIILCFMKGLSTGIIFGVAGIAILILVDHLSRPTKEMTEKGHRIVPNPSHVQRLLYTIEDNQRIANQSDDPAAVEQALETLIRVIDEMLEYEEDDLRKCGATKEHLPATRRQIIREYDVILEQARERKVIAEQDTSNEGESLSKD